MTQPYTTRTRGNGTYQFTMESNVMKSVSLKEAFKQGIITGISPVRENEPNAYLFITATNRQGKATNIYFGQKSSGQVEEGDNLTKEQLLGARLILAVNKAEGAKRLKIGLEGETEYTDLANIFDDVVSTEEHAEEVLTFLKSVMFTREESEALQDDDEDDDAEAKAKAEEVRKARADKKAGKVK